MSNNAYFNILLAFYKSGQINETDLDKAIKFRWITNEEKILIIGICSTEKIN